MTDRRITTIAGDVGTDGLGLNDADRATFATADIVIHSAATVSFDSPLTSAIEINLLGPTRIAQLCHELGITPHLVAVSTCYVAGNRRGSAPEQLVSEGPFDIGLDWRAEVAASRRLKSDSEAASRTPEQLAEFRKQARAELGAAGAPALAAKTEQLRSRWVKDQLIQAGRSRAASVGWPDAYAFTKALGEQALFESKGDVPVSIVRPSIIESAWAEPRPGWIRGFRMAEPVIISYARGLLREFPGVPEGTIDVIPVDMVVAAIIAVAAAGPDQAPFITQVASGGINPLRYRTLVDNVSGFFTRNPIYDHEGQPILVPEWRFPGRGRVQGQLDPRQADDQHRREGAADAAAARQAGRVLGDAREQAARDRARPRVRRAVRALHRVRGDLPGRQPDGAVGRPARRRPRGVRLRPASRRLDPLRQRDPPAVDPPARAGQDDARQVAHAGPHGAPAQAGARPEAPRRRVRPREHADRLERRRELLVPRHAPAQHARAHAIRAAHARPRRRACSSSTSATAPTSCATSTAATRTPRSSRSPRTRRR